MVPMMFTPAARPRPGPDEGPDMSASPAAGSASPRAAVKSIGFIRLSTPCHPLLCLRLFLSLLALMLMEVVAEGVADVLDNLVVGLEEEAADGTLPPKPQL